MKVYIIALTALFALLAGTEAKGKTNAPISVPCPCVPRKGDCGKGFRVGVCAEKTTTKIKCKVPCNWKKEFGADCKYRFGSWGECDATSGTKPRTGTLKKRLYKAECQRTVYVSKPCKPETKPAPVTKPKPTHETKPKPTHETKPKPTPETKPKPEPETKPKPTHETKPKPEPETKPKPTHETKPKPTPETKPKPEPETEPKPAPETENKPTKPKGAEMTEADKAYIVNRHNELRRGVKPTASNMLKMSWSEEAAANAQRFADKCTLGHSPKADRIISTSGCGENIAMGHSHTESSWADKIQMWYDEVKDWKYGEGSVNGKTVGHFTQVVWYRSNQIGCAAAHCPDAKYPYFYVCQYCSPGNYQYTHPYKAGPACGDCPNNCDDKLCTNPCSYKDKWNNCAELGAWGCKGDKCEASCKCKSGEII